MTIADRIINKRMELGYSQEDLAKKCGWKNRSSVSQIEKSEDNISLKKISKIADALGVSEAYLMGWEELPNGTNIYLGKYSNDTSDNTTKNTNIAKPKVHSQVNWSASNNNHAFISEFDSEGTLLFIKEITPKDMGRKWTTYEIESLDIHKKLSTMVIVEGKTDYEYIKQVIEENLSDNQLHSLSKFIDFTLYERNMELDEPERER